MKKIAEVIDVVKKAIANINAIKAARDKKDVETESYLNSLKIKPATKFEEIIKKNNENKILLDQNIEK